MLVLQALSTLRSINLDDCYRQVENLTKKLEDLKQRFGLNSTQKLVHSTHMEMEKVRAVWEVQVWPSAGFGAVQHSVCHLYLPAVGQCCVHLGAVPPIISQAAAFTDSCQDGKS